MAKELSKELMENLSKMPPALLDFLAKIPAAPLEALRQGKVVFYGEFRRGQVTEITAKGNRVFHIAKCSVETEASGTITVSEFLPDGVEWEKYQFPFAKGQMVHCIVRGLEDSSGVQIASGKLAAS